MAGRARNWPSNPDFSYQQDHFEQQIEVLFGTAETGTITYRRPSFRQQSSVGKLLFNAIDLGAAALSILLMATIIGTLAAFA